MGGGAWEGAGGLGGGGTQAPSDAPVLREKVGEVRCRSSLLRCGDSPEWSLCRGCRTFSISRGAKRLRMHAVVRQRVDSVASHVLRTPDPGRRCFRLRPRSLP